MGLVLLVMVMLLLIGGNDCSTRENMATVLYLGGSGHRVNVAVLVLLVMLFFIGSDVTFYDVMVMALYLSGVGHRLNASQERLQVPLTVGLSLFEHLFVSNI